MDSQIVLISLGWLARGACGFITTAGIAWALKKKRVSDFSEYDHVSDVACHSLLNLP
jgi:hypothetical protein